MSELAPLSGSGLDIPAPEPEVKELDQHVKILADMRECKNTIDFWTKRWEELKTQMAEIMGDAEVGTVNGEVALTFHKTERFSSGEFRKKYPDMYKFYTREVTTERFDEKWFRTTRPELWEEFQSRSMLNKWEGA